MAARKRLGERLLDQGVITESQLADAIRAQQVTGEELGSGLMRLGYVSEDDLMRLLCEDADIPYLEPDALRPEPGANGAIPQALARAHSVLALSEQNGRLRVALGNPFDIAAVTALERVTGRPLTVAAASREEITRRIEEAYGSSRGVSRTAARPAAGDGGRSQADVPGASAPLPGSAGTRATVPVPARPVVRSAAHPVAQAAAQPAVVQAAAQPAVVQAAAPTPEVSAQGGAPVGRVPVPSRVADRADTGGDDRLADDVIRRGVALGATDIRVEPGARDLAIRYRVDGTLQSGGSYPKAVEDGLRRRLRSLAGLGPGPDGVPREGRVRIPAEGRPIDLRISTFPTLHGEDVVLRVLDRGRVKLELDGLGMAPADLALVRGALRRTQGLIVVTGPTGSGKTSTLYSAVRELDSVRQSVLTLEDPIEYELEGVRQSQVDADAGYTFAAGLRTVLRHGPDAILVGELRDPETARPALGAAVTGHRVLTSMHTDSAADVVPRLVDMGAEPYLLASALELVVAQRLVRVLCHQCRSPVEVSGEIRKRHGLGDAQVYRARGCSACRQTGYRGRIAAFEVLPVTDDVERAIHGGATADEIRRIARRPTILQDGIRKVIAGVTSLEEVLKVVGG